MGCRFSRLLGEAQRRSQARRRGRCLCSIPASCGPQVKNYTWSEAEQAPEGSKWALVLRWLARRIVTGRIIPFHDDGGFPHAFPRHEIVERGGVRQREADTAVEDGRAEAWMVLRNLPSRARCWQIAATTRTGSEHL